MKTFGGGDRHCSPVETDDVLGYCRVMKTVRYIYWQDAEMWLGYIEEFPDYMTQREPMEELQDNLRDIYDDLPGGKIPGVRRAAELQIA